MRESSHKRRSGSTIENRSKKHRQPIQNVSAKGLIQIRLQKTREMNKKIPFIVGMDLALGTNRK